MKVKRSWIRDLLEGTLFAAGLNDTLSGQSDHGDWITELMLDGITVEDSARDALRYVLTVLAGRAELKNLRKILPLVPDMRRMRDALIAAPAEAFTVEKFRSTAKPDTQTLSMAVDTGSGLLILELTSLAPFYRRVKMKMTRWTNDAPETLFEVILE